MARAKGRYFIGCSGYEYPHWRERFYPKELPKKSWFEHYTFTFDTVEINNTFYRLPEVDTFDAWRERAPKGFTYAVKYSRFGTHIKRLRDPEEPVERFVSRAQHLRSHLGPILVQLPPNWHAILERLEGFLGALPSRYRWAIEFRDPSWLSDESFALLKRHKVALCIHDKLEHHPREITAPFTYLRYHGDKYKGSYSSQFLRAEADRICAFLEDGVDVYAYFNNDWEGWAIDNAKTLLKYVSKTIGPRAPPPGRSWARARAR